MVTTRLFGGKIELYSKVYVPIQFCLLSNYRLFVRNAKCSLDKIFSMYSDNIQVVSTRNLESVISDKWFG